MGDSGGGRGCSAASVMEAGGWGQVRDEGVLNLLLPICSFRATHWGL
jgi:hypothetical protein